MNMRLGNARYSAFSELDKSDLWYQTGLAAAVQACWAGAGMPRSMGTGWARRSIWAILSSAPARLVFRPSTSPSQPSRSASAMRGDEVVADLGDAGALGGVWPVQGAAQAAVLVDAGGADGAAAGAGGDFAAFEVAEQFGPFGVGGGAVFLGGPQCPAAGEEGQVGLDGLVG